MKRLRSQFKTVAVFGLLILGFNQPVQAHVKWFSEIDWAIPPKTISEITTPTFLSMFVLTLVTLALAVVADKWATRSLALKAIGDWFENRSQHGLLAMRIATFATLLVAWQQGTLFTPETAVANVWVERLQFVTIVLLLFPAMTSIAGGVFLLLWVFGAVRFGIFHMLDYVNAVGVGFFLLVRPLSNVKLRNAALPVLYSTVGFSLIWLGCEKLVYPQWALYLLEQNPMLTLGLPADFFLVASSFVEMGLGFLLIICLFSRSLSITITLVFFLTTCVFGKVEIIGHTLIHASLIVFLLEGAGHGLRPPSAFHKTTGMRIAFATVNFTVVMFALLWGYSTIAPLANPVAPAHKHPIANVPAENAPAIELEVLRDNKSGYNVHFKTTGFRFAADKVGQDPSIGEGHIHLYVDGQKIARVYSEWFHLVIAVPGEHTIRATLNTNDHADYAVDGERIEAETTIVVDEAATATNCHDPKTEAVAVNR